MQTLEITLTFIFPTILAIVYLYFFFCKEEKKEKINMISEIGYKEFLKIQKIIDGEI